MEKSLHADITLPRGVKGFEQFMVSEFPEWSYQLSWRTHGRHHTMSARTPRILVTSESGRFAPPSGPALLDSAIAAFLLESDF